MPAINFTGTGKDAAELWQISTILKGDSGSFREREKLRAKIKEVWPEIKEVGPETENDTPDDVKARIEATKAIRPIELSTKQQTALAEGFVTFLKEKEIQDAQKINILAMAKLCKVRNWVAGSDMPCALRKSVQPPFKRFTWNRP